MSKPKDEPSLRALERDLCGTPMRDLDLCDLHCQVSRIGYEDEGLRLTFSIGVPYKFNAEIKLSREDTEWLQAAFAQALADPRNANMPKGRKRTTPAGRETP